tara:strand:+ start:291 stop:1205 length:915 start_codon:yes stop_codon:yes gene_type:complete
MTNFCEGRVAIITGAGRGIGREHALMLAAHGAFVLVNDVGVERDGRGSDKSLASSVAQEIRDFGGQAIANSSDVSDFGSAKEMVKEAIDTWGHLDVLVNNAGILRDRMLVNMEESEWDAVIGVHLKGTFAPAHHAAAYWREETKKGSAVDARIINTTSVSGIYGNPGQTNYGAAKAGIAAFTVIAARELGRYGITVNAVAPGALTRMTEDLISEEITEEVREARSPKWIAPIVTWLASTESRGITGRVFEANGKLLAVAEGWERGPTIPAIADPTEIGSAVADLVSQARLNSGMNGKGQDGGVS